MAKYHLGQVKVEPKAGQWLPSGIVYAGAPVRNFRAIISPAIASLLAFRSLLARYFAMVFLPLPSRPHSGYVWLMVSMTVFSTELLSVTGAWVGGGGGGGSDRVAMVSPGLQ